MSTVPDIVSGYIEDLTIIRQTRISQLVWCTMLFYDHLITFDQEVEYIWNAGWSIPTILFFALRYVGDGLAILSIIAFLSDPSQQVFSDGFIFFAAWSESVLIWIMQIILQMRIYALYKRSRRVLVFMTATFVMEIIAMSTIMILADTDIDIVNSLPPDVQICAADGLPNFFFGWWLPIIIFEGLLCMFALCAGVRQLILRSQLEGFRGGRAVDSLVKGNVFYFLCVLIPCTLNTVVWATLGVSYVQITQGFGFATAIVVGCRVVLSLRRTLSRKTETSTELISLATIPFQETWIVPHMPQSPL
ncbi:hypothetical protein BV22DRAFT_828830 [Leucogyrophana mollusca]|uniref:Uncharacterized protein n=1 Tax=Leucogyrophana mollusca TaxID=85980 RepID=A0ACB8B3N0_9AGAM|nr:hypothetical protein BV22DRAFT_828830 [Leucogyrophana mollusca]